MRIDHLPRVSGIYKITCTANGKFYIGSAVNIYKRIYEHRRVLRKNSHHASKLQRTYNKYGETSFIAEVLLTCYKTNLVTFEQLCMDVLLPQLNSCKVAGSCLGLRHSQETKDKIGKLHKGNQYKRGKEVSKETRARIGAGNRGKKLSEEAKAKIGAASRGKVTSEETKKKISIANTGKVRTEEVKLRISQRNKGRESPNKGKKASEETRLKLSIAHKGQPSAMKGTKHSDETKQKMSLAKLGKPQPRELVEKRLASYRKTIEKRKAGKEKASLDSKEADVN